MPEDSLQPSAPSGTPPALAAGGEAAPYALTPQERRARRTARIAEQEARRAARAEWRALPQETRFLARRFEVNGMAADRALAIARYVTADAGTRPAPPPQPETADSLSVAAAFALLNAIRRFPLAREVLSPLNEKIGAAARRITDWDMLHRELVHAPQEIGAQFEAMVARMRTHPDAIALGIDDATVEAWRDSARLMLSIKLIAEGMRTGTAFAEQLRNMDAGGERMRAIDADAISRYRDPRGILLVTIHNPHLTALAHAAISNFDDHYLINADSMDTPRKVSMQLLSLIRTLRRGGAGILTPHGAFGTVDREIELFGEPMMISSAFARIAWKSGCRVIFGIGISEGRKQGLGLKTIDLPRRTEEITDETAYIDSVIHAYAAAAREAIARHPFDIGISHRLGKKPPASRGGRGRQAVGITGPAS